MDGRVTTLLFAAAFVAAVVGGRLAVLGFVAVLTAMASGEIYRLSRSRGYEPVPLVGLLGMGALLFASHMRGDDAPAIFPGIIAAVIGVAFVALMARRKHVQVARGIAFTLLPVLTVGLLASHVLVIRGEREGMVLALLLGAMIAAAEMAAWAWERWGARRAGGGARLWLRFVAALAGSALAGGIVGLLDPTTIGPLDGLALGALVGIAASAGERVGAMIEADLLEAQAGVKRVSAQVLRRIDGALLGAPVFFYALRVLAR